MSSRLDLPSTRSTVASAIPVTHASSSRYSPSQLLTPHLPATPAPKTFTGCHSFDRRNLFPRPYAPRSATTLFISKVYRFGSLLWVSEKICWVSTTCSDEHPSPPFDVPVSSPPISNFGVSLKYSPSPVKRMVVSNPRIDNGPTKQPWIGLLDCGWFSYVSCTSLSLMDALGSAEDPVLQVPSMAELNYTQGACAVSSIASGWISATTPNGGRTNNLCHSYGLS
ncbi:hypothetical protein Bca52824_071772 [Brassica carinata]|uniref:Uncharacterized protein n=1 Tax=Brassica carinata TaxID=52824 RepID=A0A8X7QAR6_BRACI|nr:hypothetical protein Bca52824_071772 [Brassica carinata]